MVLHLSGISENILVVRTGLFKPRKFVTKNSKNIDTTFNTTAISYSGFDHSVNKE
jgi:hypothetical protein